MMMMMMMMMTMKRGTDENGTQYVGCVLLQTPTGENERQKKTK